MSEKYGTHLGGENYAFPTAKALNEAGEAELFALKTGFRAKYLADASARVTDGRLDLEKINEIPSTAECVKKLCEVKGIGPKVASCALLFGFGRLRRNRIRPSAANMASRIRTPRRTAFPLKLNVGISSKMPAFLPIR